MLTKTITAITSFIILFVFSYQATAQTTTTILGPKKYYVTNQNGTTYTENINRTQTQTNYQYQLTINNADGADHPVKNCQGLNFFARLSCNFENALQQAYVNLFRVNSALITINNTALTSTTNFNKTTKSLVVPLTLEQSNQLKITIKGSLFSFIDVKLEATSVATDTAAPTVLANINSNSLTRNPLVHISVNDASSTTTYIRDNAAQILASSTLKEFDFALSEGLNNLHIQSIDAYNNQSIILDIINVTLDTTSPSLSSTLNSEYIYNSYPQTITINISSNEDLQSLTVNNLSATMLDPRHFQYLLSINEPQTVNLSIKGFDLAGNESIISQSINFGIENLAPVISSTRSANSFTNIASFDVSISDNSETTTQVYTDGLLTQTTTDKNITLNLNPGTNSFIIKSVDQYGNQAPDLILSNITYDITPPQLTNNIQPLYYQAFFPDTFDFEFTSNEALQLFRVNGQTIPSENGINYDVTITINQPTGNSLNTRAVDLAGNVTLKSYPLQIIFDNQAPQIIFGAVPQITSDESFLLSVQIFDQTPVNSVLYVNGVEIASTNVKNFSYLIELPTDGEYEIELYSEDRAGNYNSSITRTIKKDDMIPPVITNNLQASYTVTSLPNVVEVQFTSNEVLQSLVADGQSLTSNNLVYTYQKQISQINSNDISIVAVDMSGNVTEATYNFNVVLDDLAPEIIIGNVTTYTNENSVLLPITINENTDTQTEIKVNGQYIATIAEKNFSYLIELPSDGIYNITISSTDFAGNNSQQSLAITKDTQPLILSIQSPQSGSVYSSQLVEVRFSTNKIISKAYVNDVEVSLNADQRSVTYNLSNWSDGLFSVQIKVEDYLGNITEQNVEAEIRLGGAASWAYEECPVE